MDCIKNHTAYHKLIYFTVILVFTPKKIMNTMRTCIKNSFKLNQIKVIMNVDNPYTSYNTVR